MTIGSSLVPVLLLLPGLAGLWLIVRGIRGRLLLSEPRCAKCRHDLRRFDGVHEQCPECGIDLEGGRRVRFARRGRRPWIAVAGLLVLVLGPALVLFTVRAINAAANRAQLAATMQAGVRINPNMLQQTDDAALAAALAQQYDNPWVWKEIERRRAAGTFADELIREALVDLLDTRESVPRTGRGGLTWGREALQAWRSAGIIDGELDQRLFFDGVELTATLPSRARAGDRVEFSIRSRHNDVLTHLERARGPDGTALPLSFDDRPFHNRVAGHGQLSGKVELDVPPGEQQITFELVLGRMDPVTATGLRSMRTPPALEAWPQEIVRRTRDVTATVTIVADDSPLVTTTVDPGDRQAVRDALEPMGVSAVVQQDGRINVTIVTDRDGSRGIPVPAVMRIFIRSGEERWRTGAIGRSANRSYRGGGGSLDRDALPRTIETVDVVFVPDLEIAAERGFADQGPIWGEEVVFEDVKVTWFEAE